MKYRNALVDDDGQKWEFSYEQNASYKHGADGTLVYETNDVLDFRYRKDGETDWLTLPPWADIAEEWKINLGFFDEDEETEEMTFWRLTNETLVVEIGLPGGEG